MIKKKNVLGMHVPTVMQWVKNPMQWLNLLWRHGFSNGVLL